MDSGKVEEMTNNNKSLEGENKYKDQIVCRGSYALGTACGVCARCIDERNNNPDQPTVEELTSLLRGFSELIRIQEEEYHIGKYGNVVLETVAERLEALQARIKELEKENASISEVCKDYYLRIVELEGKK